MTATTVPAPCDIVVFVPSKWRVVNSLPEYTVLGFARAGHRVLVVEPFHTPMSGIRAARQQNRAAEWAHGINQVDERIWVYRPLPVAVPGRSRSALAARLSAHALALLVRRACSRLGFVRPVAWSYRYETGRTMAAMRAAASIYDCGDFEAALAQTARQRRTLLRMEAETCRGADLVIACTDELADVLRPHNANTVTVNCAASVDFFAKALAPETVVPPDLAAIRGSDPPRVVVGYLGGIDPFKMDVPLIHAIARARPHWSIVLIGYVWFGFDAASLTTAPNVHVLGPRDYAAFPDYLKGMDVGLLPFPDNEITRNGDALKCYEYLAAGLPVVGRPVPVARRLAPLVRLAQSADEFIAQIELALAEGPSEKAHRQAAIRAHDWSVRVAAKRALLDGVLEARRAAQK